MFFDWLYVQLNYKSMCDWYHLTRETIYKHGGQGLLNTYYNSSPSQALQSVYPQHKWQLENFTYKPSILWTQKKPQLLFFEHLQQDFKQAPNGYWKSLDNQKEFFNWIGENISIKKLSDWYSVNFEDVQKFGTQGLLRKYYSNSLSKALMNIYPDHKWLCWMFKPPPFDCWDNTDNQKSFFNWLYIKLLQ